MPKAKDKSPKPERSRRQSLPDTSDVTSPKPSRSKGRKSASPSPSKTRRQDNVLSSENLKSAKELLEEIQQYAEKWITCESESETKTDTRRDPEVSSPEEGTISVVKQSVVAEVHQTEDKARDKATKKRIRNRTRSHESVVRFADELIEVREFREFGEPLEVKESEKSLVVKKSAKPQEVRESPKRRTINPTVLANLKLIASSKLVSQSSEEHIARARAARLAGPTRSIFPLLPTYSVTPVVHPYLQALYQDYSRDYEREPPPPPAPADPHQGIQYKLGGAYSNNALLSPSAELPWSTETRSLRESELSNFMPYRSIPTYEPTSRCRSVPPELLTPRANVSHVSPYNYSLQYQSQAFRTPYEIASFSESLPTEYRYDLPRLSPYQSPRRQPQQHQSSRLDEPHQIFESPRRSFQSENQFDIPCQEEFENIKASEPYQRPYDRDFFYVECHRREFRPFCKSSARTFLELSPDFDFEFDKADLKELPQDEERRPRGAFFLGSRGKRTRSSKPPREPRPWPLTRRNLSLVKGSGTKVSRSMGRMNHLEDHERKIVIEFCHLLEKSKQLFNGLRPWNLMIPMNDDETHECILQTKSRQFSRTTIYQMLYRSSIPPVNLRVLKVVYERELPQYGHKQWHSYFGRTFDVYTKLWKFQQQHRVILDGKYGLKRWQIGEIASKIGQLYYHFYLRTSETAYLNEAYSFYYAIRGRSYYTQASKEDKCELMVKKLRYYARFIVASLLLKKVKLVRELIKELDRQIIEYGNTYDPDDQNEWKIVADEVRAFIKAEPVVVVLHPDDYAVVLTHRLTPQSTPPVERSAVMTLSLQEALIIGSNSAQVKFSELTMDMFRMLQTLEREPTGDIQHMYDESPRQRYISTPSAANNKGCNLECSNSPHKYLLFKPSPNQIFVYLASACDDLPPNGVVLLYISAEGLIVPPMKHPIDSNGFDIGGLITTSRLDIVHKDILKDGKLVPQKFKELQVLHPGDLYPFTRRPMFLIIDSDNSFIFHDLPRYFGQPLVILMSPLEQPSALHPTSGDKRAEGSLFTLFLHCPLSAFCFCCDITTLSLGQWERAQSFIDAYLAEASQILTRSRIDGMYLAFMGDDFLRLLILRFIFCETFLRMHRLFRGRTQRTRSSPPLPDDLYEHPGLTHIIIDLATHFQVRGHFHDPSAMPAPLASNRE